MAEMTEVDITDGKGSSGGKDDGDGGSGHYRWRWWKWMLLTEKVTAVVEMVAAV
jgi:hypothetical protein